LVTTPLAALPATNRLGADPGFGVGSSPTVMGDWYWSSSLLGANVAGGFRASSGWLMGSQVLGGDAARSGVGSGISDGLTEMQPQRLSGASGLPYVGLGYTGVSVGGSWGVTADVGLVATNPGALRANRAWQNSQAVDDLVRELRLTPLVRLGVSYAF
jgi:hypothetical protein